MQELKRKACRNCNDKFAPFNSTTVVCSTPCAIAYAHSRADKKALSEKRKTDKLARAELKQRREALKTASDWKREAQKAFNAWIRARDYGKVCISSGRMMDWRKMGGAVDAGHYRSTGAASHLRFNVFNCHAQSVEDNHHLSGNAVDYRIHLINRIGLERVERLENDNTPRTFTIEYLKRVKSIFTRRAKLYRKFRGIEAT